MNGPADWSASGERLERYLHEAIPVAAHMQVHVARCDHAGLTLTAPLAPNINHKLSAFGGSLSSLATLACWGVLWLLLADRPQVHIVVSESRMRYLHPVTQELAAHCDRPAPEALGRFLEMLDRRGRGRLGLQARIIQNGVVCAEYEGSFVAYRSET